MTNKPKQFDIKQALIESAQSYFQLLDCEIVLQSQDFIEQSSYMLKFFKTNFLHLTGLKTSLSTEDFFLRCYAGTILESDYTLGPTNDRNTVKRKLKNLIHINDFFKSKIMVQETFVKNKVVCKIATSDEKYTIGFVDAKYYLRPQTILANNHLDKSRPIYIVSPIINKQ